MQEDGGGGGGGGLQDSGQVGDVGRDKLSGEALGSKPQYDWK